MVSSEGGRSRFGLRNRGAVSGSRRPSKDHCVNQTEGAQHGKTGRRLSGSCANGRSFVEDCVPSVRSMLETSLEQMKGELSEQSQRLQANVVQHVERLRDEVLRLQEENQRLSQDPNVKTLSIPCSVDSPRDGSNQSSPFAHPPRDVNPLHKEFDDSDSDEELPAPQGFARSNGNSASAVLSFDEPLQNGKGRSESRRAIHDVPPILDDTDGEALRSPNGSGSGSRDQIRKDSESRFLQPVVSGRISRCREMHSPPPPALIEELDDGIEEQVAGMVNSGNAGGGRTSAWTADTGMKNVTSGDAPPMLQPAVPMQTLSPPPKDSIRHSARTILSVVPRHGEGDNNGTQEAGVGPCRRCGGKHDSVACDVFDDGPTRRALYSRGSDAGTTSTQAIVKTSKSMILTDPPLRGWAAARSGARYIVSSFKFDLFFAGVIMTNSAFMGIQMDDEISRKYMGQEMSQTPLAFTVINYIYSCLFLCELILRLMSEGTNFFKLHANWHWNYLDFFIVMASCAEIAFDIIVLTAQDSDASTVEVTASAATNSGDKMRIIRIIRISRLMRVFRVARIVRFIRALRTLVYSILCTLKTVMWALLLLLMIIYVFGMIFASVVSEASCSVLVWEAIAQDPEVVVTKLGCVRSQSLRLFWGTLPRAMFTLFKTIAGGISWHDVVLPLSDIGVIWVIFFIGYVSFTFFAVLNVITGVFCESAIESSRSDHELVILQHMAERKAYIKKVQALYDSIDSDRSDAITLAEFEAHMRSEMSSAIFSTLELEMNDAGEIFCLIDTDDGGTVDIEEFVNGCLRLRGQARAIDLARMASDQRALARMLHDRIRGLQNVVHRVLDEVVRQGDE
eukprot:TRINITY_DN9155_c0_g1_i2.p1 TRINITY_DN9155_c0_g1~~TRINITY_DN9155_c0_g1_i2.p1  ORF type:complete len:849 (+),score=134.75 TRINITY_DN9155_c0_g1_i2:335-2881(+)